MPDEVSRTQLLGMAVNGNDIALCEWALEKGADPDYSDSSGLPFLQVACSKGYIDMVRRLVMYNADLDIEDEIGETPLHKAIEHGYCDVVDYLIEKGAHLLEKEDYCVHPNIKIFDEKKKPVIDGNYTENQCNAITKSFDYSVEVPRNFVSEVVRLIKSGALNENKIDTNILFGVALENMADILLGNKRKNKEYKNLKHF